MPQKKPVTVWLGSRTVRIQEVIPMSGKNPYSLVDVNRILIDPQLAQLGRSALPETNQPRISSLQSKGS